MISRRDRLHWYYRYPPPSPAPPLAPEGLSPFGARLGPFAGSALEALATANHERYAFKGDRLVSAVVVRVDLNGYSAWARGRPVEDRARLLDDFFSKVVPTLEASGGVFLRDEGDCIVGLFSNYFESTWSPRTVLQFCLAAVGSSYSGHPLPPFTAKAVVACGEVAIYQKRHERADGDWSAEGQPFVTALRLEQAIDSRPHACMLATDFDQMFGRQFVLPTGCQLDVQDKQVEGLGLPGGWTKLARLVAK